MSFVSLFSLWLAQSIAPLTEPAAYLGSPALSPDGKTLAFWWADKDFKKSGLFTRPVDGGEFVLFAGALEEGIPGSPVWSPDGTRIAFQRGYCHNCNDKLFIKDYPEGSERDLGEVCKNSVSWTPDGRYIVAAEPLNDGEESCRVTLIPVDGGARIFLANDGDVAAVSPDGKRLAYAVGNQLKIAPLTSDRHFERYPVTIATEPHAISSILWTPDGRSLLYQVWRYTRLLTVDGAASRLIDPGANVGISQILSNGDVLATEEVAGASLWRLDPGSAPVKVRDIPWTDDELRVSPDGKLLAFATNRNGPTQIWISRFNGSEARVLVSAIPPFEKSGDGTIVDSISWSPDGKWIALNTQAGVGHGDTAARCYVIPATGGPLRELVEECSQDGPTPRWSAHSESVFISRVDDDYKPHYFRVDIGTRKETAVEESSVPPRPAAPNSEPSLLSAPHLAGQVLFYTQDEERRSRVVLIHKLLDP